MDTHSGTSLTDYLDAIFQAEHCEELATDGYRCVIAALAGCEAVGQTCEQAGSRLSAQVYTWVARHLVRRQPLPEFAGIAPEIVDIVVPDVITGRLRLVPSTATLVAAAACDRAALATLLGARIHPDWPDLDAPSGGTDRATDTAKLAEASPGEQSLSDLLELALILQNPAIAPWDWLIIHARDGVLIGGIGTSNPPAAAPGEDSIQISYGLVPEYRGQGLMTEAARAYVAWAFTHPELTWISAMTEVSNVASQRVLAKLGARRMSTDAAEVGWIDWELDRA